MYCNQFSLSSFNYIAAFDSPDLADTFVESMLGHTVLIDCCIDGKLTDFGWYRNGRKIYEGDDDVSGVRSKYLVLRNVSEEDVGLYTCVSLISEQEFLHQTYLNFTMIIGISTMHYIILFTLSHAWFHFSSMQQSA